MSEYDKGDRGGRSGGEVNPSTSKRSDPLAQGAPVDSRLQSNVTQLELHAPLDARRLAQNVSAVFVATWAVTRLRNVSFFDELVALFVALIFLYGALRPLGRGEATLRENGIWLGGLFAPPKTIRAHDPFGLRDLWRLFREGFFPAMRELAVALLVAAITFPPFFFGFRLYNQVGGLPSFDLPSGFVALALGHLFVVAFPEEVYFRGFLQSELRKRFPLPITLVIQSALFAAIHFVVDFHPARLAVFFPGLLFGLLRHKRGGVGAAIFFHALCNIYADLLLRGYGVV